MKPTVRKFLVSEYRGIGPASDRARIAVSTGSPEEAAALILGVDLVREGNLADVRAVVELVEDDGSVEVMALYQTQSDN